MKGSFRARTFIRRSAAGGSALAILALLFALVLPASRTPASLDSRLGDVAGSESFGLMGWEVQSLSNRWSQALIDPAPPGGPDLVLRYSRLSGEEARVRSQRDEEWAKKEVTGTSPELAATEQRLAALDAQLAQIRPAVEATVSQEIEAELRSRQVRRGLLTWDSIVAFPFARPEVTPGVFFQLGPLPNLLVVAPPDRIELVDSVLLQPDLSPTQVDSLESGADALGVSSVVTGIGGLAAYPSMLPDSSSPKDLLFTVAHEWTHHYLALRPLGVHYFDNYEMRTINETVADMVGAEVGGAVYERLYPALPPPGQTAVPRPAAPARPDFGALMRQIRVAVEGYLARHDVAGANAYMADQRQELVKDGYYVRRLNTAYLAFFGSYSGSANPVEPKLRRIRQRAGSLAAFLEIVSQIQTPQDLDRLAST